MAESPLHDPLPGSSHEGSGQGHFQNPRPHRKISPRRFTAPDRAERLRHPRFHQRRTRPAPKQEEPILTIPDIRQLAPDDLPQIEEENKLILAPSKKIVMEWCLVLTSQKIESTILFPHKQRWFLMVKTEDYARSLEIIHLYLVENRNWGWSDDTFRMRGQLFNWGAFYWALPTGLTYLLNYLAHDGLKMHGLMDSDKILQDNEWWRMLTATFLHGDIGHLASNLSLGFPLFGLAMGRYGIGWTLLAATLAGLCGNLLSLLIHPTEYASLGASGVVMGVLGILSVYLMPLISKKNLPAKVGISAFSASVLIFILTGLSPDPQVNLSAHLGGFLGGIFAGFLLNKVPEKWILHKLTNVILTILWFAICSYCWATAIGQ